MKFVVDRIPTYKHGCIFNDHSDYEIAVTFCKIDDLPCNLQEMPYTHCMSCRWLKEEDK